MGEKYKVMEIQKVMEKSWNFSTANRESRMRNSDKSIIISIGLLQWFGYMAEFQFMFLIPNRNVRQI